MTGEGGERVVQRSESPAHAREVAAKLLTRLVAISALTGCNRLSHLRSVGRIQLKGRPKGRAKYRNSEMRHGPHGTWATIDAA